MGGHSKKAGKGGGGGGGVGRNCPPEARRKLSKDPGVPGDRLRRVGESLLKTKQGHQRRIMNIPSLDRRNYPGMGTQSASYFDRVTGRVVELPAPGTEMTQQEKERQNISDMAALALLATQRQAQYDSCGGLLKEDATNCDYSDQYLSIEERQSNSNTLRRFYKEFQHVVNSSDVLLEVVDARDPMGCRLLHLERAIRSQFGDKKTIIILLNKIDLLPNEQILAAWMEYFKEEAKMPHVLGFTAGRDAGGRSQRASCTAALFKLLRDIARGAFDEGGSSGARKHITVGVIGYPNVGKSSIINTLKGHQAVGVGNTPGFTTGTTQVDLRQDIVVLDCPGVVMPDEDNADVVLRNAMKLEKVASPIVALERLVERCGQLELARAYNVVSECFEGAPPVEGHYDGPVAKGFIQRFVKAVGVRRGRVRRGGIIDEDETCRIILKDWNDGRIGYYTLPPERNAFWAQVDARCLRRERGDADEEELEDMSDVAKGASFITKLGHDVTKDGMPVFHLIQPSTSGASLEKRLKKRNNGAKRPRNRRDADRARDMPAEDEDSLEEWDDEEDGSASGSDGDGSASYGDDHQYSYGTAVGADSNGDALQVKSLVDDVSAIMARDPRAALDSPSIGATPGSIMTINRTVTGGFYSPSPHTKQQIEPDQRGAASHQSSRGGAQLPPGTARPLRSGIEATATGPAAEALLSEAEPYEVIGAGNDRMKAEDGPAKLPNPDTVAPTQLLPLLTSLRSSIAVLEHGLEEKRRVAEQVQASLSKRITEALTKESELLRDRATSENSAESVRGRMIIQELGTVTEIANERQRELLLTDEALKRIAGAVTRGEASSAGLLLFIINVHRAFIEAIAESRGSAVRLGERIERALVEAETHFEEAMNGGDAAVNGDATGRSKELERLLSVPYDDIDDAVGFMLKSELRGEGDAENGPADIRRRVAREDRQSALRFSPSRPSAHDGSWRHSADHENDTTLSEAFQLRQRNLDKKESIKRAYQVLVESKIDPAQRIKSDGAVSAESKMILSDVAYTRLLARVESRHIHGDTSSLVSSNDKEKQETIRYTQRQIESCRQSLALLAIVEDVPARAAALRHALEAEFKLFYHFFQNVYTKNKTLLKNEIKDKVRALRAAVPVVKNQSALMVKYQSEWEAGQRRLEELRSELGVTDPGSTKPTTSPSDKASSMSKMEDERLESFLRAEEARGEPYLPMLDIGSSDQGGDSHVLLDDEGVLRPEVVCRVLGLPSVTAQRIPRRWLLGHDDTGTDGIDPLLPYPSALAALRVRLAALERINSSTQSAAELHANAATAAEVAVQEARKLVEEYKEKHERLASLVSGLRSTTEERKRKIETLKSEWRDLVKRRETAEAATNGHESEYDSLKHKLNQQESEAILAEQTIAALEMKRDAARAQAKIAQNNVNEYKAKVKVIEMEVERLHAARSAEQKRYQSLLETVNARKAKIAQVAEKTKALEAELIEAKEELSYVQGLAATQVHQLEKAKANYAVQKEYAEHYGLIINNKDRGDGAEVIPDDDTYATEEDEERWRNHILAINRRVLNEGNSMFLSDLQDRIGGEPTTGVSAQSLSLNRNLFGVSETQKDYRGELSQGPFTITGEAQSSGAPDAGAPGLIAESITDFQARLQSHPEANKSPSPQVNAAQSSHAASTNNENTCLNLGSAASCPGAETKLVSLLSSRRRVFGTAHGGNDGSYYNNVSDAASNLGTSAAPRGGPAADARYVQPAAGMPQKRGESEEDVIKKELNEFNSRAASYETRATSPPPAAFGAPITSSVGSIHSQLNNILMRKKQREGGGVPQ